MLLPVATSWGDRCASLPNSALSDISHPGSLKLAKGEVFTPQKSANATNQGLLCGEPFSQHTPGRVLCNSQVAASTSRGRAPEGATAVAVGPLLSQPWGMDKSQLESTSQPLRLADSAQHTPLPQPFQ